MKIAHEQEDENRDYTIQRLESYYKAKINELKKRKVDSDYEDETDSEDPYSLSELQDEVVRLEAKSEKWKNIAKDLRKKLADTTAEKNEAAYVMTFLKEKLARFQKLNENAELELCGDKDSENYVKQLKTEIDELAERKMVSNRQYKQLITFKTY